MTQEETKCLVPIEIVDGVTTKAGFQPTPTKELASGSMVAQWLLIMAPLYGLSLTSPQ